MHHRVSLPITIAVLALMPHNVQRAYSLFAPVQHSRSISRKADTANKRPRLVRYSNLSPSLVVPPDDKSNFRGSSIVTRFSAAAHQEQEEEDVDEENGNIKSRGAFPKITVVEKAQDLLDFLSEDDRLCIVKFYASWCKSCQKFGLRYQKLAMQEGDKYDSNGNLIQAGRVRFAEVEFSANARLCRTLSIKRLPNIHMYKSSTGKLTDFACGPSKFQLVIDKMNEYLSLSEDELIFNKHMEEGSALANQIVAKLKGQLLEETHTMDTRKPDGNSTSSMYR